jgi:hypothetical protein
MTIWSSEGQGETGACQSARERARRLWIEQLKTNDEGCNHVESDDRKDLQARGLVLDILHRVGHGERGGRGDGWPGQGELPAEEACGSARPAAGALLPT